MDDDTYLAREKDIFVKADGQEMIYFGRDEKDEVSFFVFSDDSHSFERMDE
ncbi:MAG: hypothetical protein AAFO07_09720 [Bacteroidota bacterium]